MNTELGILKELIERKKTKEAVAVVESQAFLGVYGNGIAKKIKDSVEAGKFDEALNLVLSMDGFFRTVREKLRLRSAPNFGTGLLPDDDW